MCSSHFIEGREWCACCFAQGSGLGGVVGHEIEGWGPPMEPEFLDVLEAVASIESGGGGGGSLQVHPPPVPGSLIFDVLDEMRTQTPARHLDAYHVDVHDVPVILWMESWKRQGWWD